jgi:hypothetical protein
VMRQQMARLVAAAGEPHVTVQVVPFSAGAHAGMQGAFVIMDFPDPADPEIIYVESMAGDLFLEAEADIRRYRLLFDNLRAVALGPDDSSSVIAGLAQEGQ